MSLLVRLLMGGALGLALGGAIGYFGKCSSGGCPLLGHPLRGMLVGAVLGLVFAFVTRSAGEEMEKTLAGVQELSQPEQLDRVLESAAGPVVVDFYLTWCGPCRRLAPTIAQLADAYRGRAEFFRVDGEKSPDLARRYGVEAYPTVVVFHRGVVVETLRGARPAEAYRQALLQIEERERNKRE